MRTLLLSSVALCLATQAHAESSVRVNVAVCSSFRSAHQLAVALTLRQDMEDVSTCVVKAVPEALVKQLPRVLGVVYYGAVPFEGPTGAFEVFHYVNPPHLHQ